RVPGARAGLSLTDGPRPTPSCRRGLVLPRVRRADRGAGTRVGRDQAPRPDADLGADRLGQDPRRVPRGDRRPRPRCARERRAPGRDARAVRLAAQGAVERHPEEPRGPPRRHPPRALRARVAGCADQGVGAHRRHAAKRARADAAHAAAHSRDDARVALHPADVGVRPANAVDRRDRDRPRDPPARRQQAWRASRAVARAARGTHREAAGTPRPVRFALFLWPRRPYPLHTREPYAIIARSLDRREAITATPPFRSGVSATTRPIERVARFLAGTGRGPCEIVDVGHVRDRDLAIELPSAPLEPIMPNEVWTEIYD